MPLLAVRAIEHRCRKARVLDTVSLVNALEQESQEEAGLLAKRGYLPCSSSRGAMLFCLLSKPHEQISAIITINSSFSKRNGVFDEAERAMLDCLTHIATSLRLAKTISASESGQKPAS